MTLIRTVLNVDTTYVGIDIGKCERQIYENNKSYSIGNTQKRIDTRLNQRKNLSDVIIIRIRLFEPTGGYEKQLFLSLNARKANCASCKLCKSLC